LNDKSLSSNAWYWIINLVSECLDVEALSNGIVYSKSCRLSSSCNTTLTNVLSRAASFSVDIALSSDILVGVLDPSHNLLIGSHVWAETIDSSSNIPLLDKLHSVPPGNSFELILTQLSWVNFHSSLGSSEWDIGDSKLESHEGSQGFNLLKVNVFSISCTSLGG